MAHSNSRLLRRIDIVGKEKYPCDADGEIEKVEEVLFGPSQFRTSMVRTWVSGGQNTEVVDRLRREITDLETRRDKLVDTRKSKLFQWASSVFKSNGIPPGNLTKEISEIMAEYESITQELFDKEVLLSERMDEQAKFDSLG